MVKINGDARRAITIVFLNLRFLLIELIFATHRDEYMYAVPTSGKSGKSEDNKKSLVARRAISSVFVY